MAPVRMNFGNYATTGCASIVGNNVQKCPAWWFRFLIKKEFEHVLVNVLWCIEVTGAPDFARFDCTDKFKQKPWYNAFALVYAGPFWDCWPISISHFKRHIIELWEYLLAKSPGINVYREIAMNQYNRYQRALSLFCQLQISLPSPDPNHPVGSYLSQRKQASLNVNIHQQPSQWSQRNMISTTFTHPPLKPLEYVPRSPSQGQLKKKAKIQDEQSMFALNEFVSSYGSGTTKGQREQMLAIQRQKDSLKKVSKTFQDEQTTSFPRKLFNLLGYSSSHHSDWNDIISWIEDGGAFAIHNQARFAGELMGYCFSGKYETLHLFVQALQEWGFSKIGSSKVDERSSSEQLVFVHPYFLRGNPSILDKITKVSEGMQSKKNDSHAIERASKFPSTSCLPANKKSKESRSKENEPPSEQLLLSSNGKISTLRNTIEQNQEKKNPTETTSTSIGVSFAAESESKKRSSMDISTSLEPLPSKDNELVLDEMIQQNQAKKNQEAKTELEKDPSVDDTLSLVSSTLPCSTKRSQDNEGDTSQSDGYQSDSYWSDGSIWI